MAEAEDKKKPLSFSEKFRNICLGIAAMSALILGLVNAFKGEPTAEKAWETSQEAINKNRTAINKLGDGLRKLHLMFVHMQGQQEGYNNAKLLRKIEELEKEKERLAIEADAQPESRQCPPGWVKIEGRCSKNRAAIAKAAKAAEEKAEKAEKAVKAERRMREAAERAHMQAQQVPLPQPKPMSKLKPLPKKLDDAAKATK